MNTKLEGGMVMDDQLRLNACMLAPVPPPFDWRTPVEAGTGKTFEKLKSIKFRSDIDCNYNISILSRSAFSSAQNNRDPHERTYY